MENCCVTCGKHLYHLPKGTLELVLFGFDNQLYMSVLFCNEEHLLYFLQTEKRFRNRMLRKGEPLEPMLKGKKKASDLFKVVE